jgi:calcium permeable stress-gated cation channel
LVLAILVIIWVCGVFFTELRVYIKVRQDYLTSAEHRLRASATTVLVTAIPRKWLTTQALGGLYDVFPGGIRNIWINQRFDELLNKIQERDGVFAKLEAAETKLIRKAKKAHRKQQEKEDKAAARKTKQKSPTKEQREQIEDENAKRLAQSGGVTAGDPHHPPQNVDDIIGQESEVVGQQQESRGDENFKKNTFGGGLAAVGQGIGKGFGVVGKTGGAVIGGAFNVVGGIDNQLRATNGFMNNDDAAEESYDEYGRFRDPNFVASYGADVKDPERMEREDGAATPASSQGSVHSRPGMGLPGNNVRRVTYDEYGGDGANDREATGKDWWKFWKPPSGGYATPIPTGYGDGDEFPLTRTDEMTPSSKEGQKLSGKSSFLSKIIPFLHHDHTTPTEYPLAYDPNYKEDAVDAAWEKYLKKKDRPTHRLPIFGWTPGWLPGLPLLNKKVDTIYWCRGELARLNMEIEMDQKHPERFPLMSSAFIQFNHQLAAHMASQAVTHHIPRHMAPRTVEISPNDVLWDNMSISWLEAWIRLGGVIVFVIALVILFAFPVAWTASLAQISSLADKYSWLHWLNRIPQKVLQAVAGVLPALVLTLLLAIVPPLFNHLAHLSGAQTGMQQQKYVQNFYFAFLFVQVFLVVSISGGAFAALSSAENITAIPDTLATQLPKAANYFFSYMILQALSTSSGTLLQLTTLIFWFVLPKLFDSTARKKWARNTNLPSVSWGTYFPVYTNFACIALIYSIVAPWIIVFAIITFTLLWIANRYNMLYVSRFQLDTGGLLYPTAINQTFTGLYVMELCLVGLFFLVQDAAGQPACVPQAIIMIVSIGLTALYQILLNISFAPLLSHLPVTIEDEAVIRDEAFARMQARRFNLDDEQKAEEVVAPSGGLDIELSTLNESTSKTNKLSNFNPANMVQEAGSWAVRSGHALGSKVRGHDSGNDSHAEDVARAQLMRKRRNRDIEAQQKIANALYGGYTDEIEDLMPAERDFLVKNAFQHYALRARRPILWIPRDDIGVSDDEVKRTREFADSNIWITNVGAALDGKFRAVYGRNPPDFSEVDLISL